MVDKLENLVVRLAGRWADESQFENIAEYQKVIEAELPRGFTITRMTKRPFGFEFTIGDGFKYQVFCTSRQYGCKRVA